MEMRLAGFMRELLLRLLQQQLLLLRDSIVSAWKRSTSTAKDLQVVRPFPFFVHFLGRPASRLPCQVGRSIYASETIADNYIYYICTQRDRTGSRRWRCQFRQRSFFLVPASSLASAPARFSIDGRSSIQVASGRIIFICFVLCALVGTSGSGRRRTERFFSCPRCFFASHSSSFQCHHHQQRHRISIRIAIISSRGSSSVTSNEFIAISASSSSSYFPNESYLFLHPRPLQQHSSVAASFSRHCCIAIGGPWWAGHFACVGCGAARVLEQFDARGDPSSSSFIHPCLCSCCRPCSRIDSRSASSDALE